MKAAPPRLKPAPADSAGAWAPQPARPRRAALRSSPALTPFNPSHHHRASLPAAPAGGHVVAAPPLRPPAVAAAVPAAPPAALARFRARVAAASSLSTAAGPPAPAAAAAGTAASAPLASSGASATAQPRATAAVLATAPAAPVQPAARRSAAPTEGASTRPLSSVRHGAPAAAASSRAAAASVAPAAPAAALDASALLLPGVNNTSVLLSVAPPRQRARIPPTPRVAPAPAAAAAWAPPSSLYDSAFIFDVERDDDSSDAGGVGTNSGVKPAAAHAAAALGGRLLPPPSPSTPPRAAAPPPPANGVTAVAAASTRDEGEAQRPAAVDGHIDATRLVSSPCGDSDADDDDHGGGSGGAAAYAAVLPHSPSAASACSMDELASLLSPIAAPGVELAAPAVAGAVAAAPLVTGTGDAPLLPSALARALAVSVEPRLRAPSPPPTARVACGTRSATVVSSAPPTPCVAGAGEVICGAAAPGLPGPHVAAAGDVGMCSAAGATLPIAAESAPVNPRRPVEMAAMMDVDSAEVPTGTASGSIAAMRAAAPPLLTPALRPSLAPLDSVDLAVSDAFGGLSVAAAAGRSMGGAGVSLRRRTSRVHVSTPTGSPTLRSLPSPVGGLSAGHAALLMGGRVRSASAPDASPPALGGLGIDEAASHLQPLQCGLPERPNSAVATHLATIASSSSSSSSSHGGGAAGGVPGAVSGGAKRRRSLRLAAGNLASLTAGSHGNEDGAAQRDGGGSGGGSGSVGLRLALPHAAERDARLHSGGSDGDEDAAGAHSKRPASARARMLLMSSAGCSEPGSHVGGGLVAGVSGPPTPSLTSVRQDRVGSVGSDWSEPPSLPLMVGAQQAGSGGVPHPQPARPPPTNNETRPTLRPPLHTSPRPPSSASIESAESAATFGSSALTGRLALLGVASPMLLPAPPPCVLAAGAPSVSAAAGTSGDAPSWPCAAADAPHPRPFARRATFAGGSGAADEAPSGSAAEQQRLGAEVGASQQPLTAAAPSAFSFLRAAASSSSRATAASILTSGAVSAAVAPLSSCAPPAAPPPTITTTAPVPGSPAPAAAGLTAAAAVLAEPSPSGPVPRMQLASSCDASFFGRMDAESSLDDVLSCDDGEPAGSGVGGGEGHDVAAPTRPASAWPPRSHDLPDFSPTPAAAASTTTAATAAARRRRVSVGSRKQGGAQPAASAPSAGSRSSASAVPAAAASQPLSGAKRLRRRKSGGYADSASVRAVLHHGGRGGSYFSDVSDADSDEGGSGSGAAASAGAAAAGVHLCDISVGLPPSIFGAHAPRQHECDLSLGGGLPPSIFGPLPPQSPALPQSDASSRAPGDLASLHSEAPAPMFAAEAARGTTPPRRGRSPAAAARGAPPSSPSYAPPSARRPLMSPLAKALLLKASSTAAGGYPPGGTEGAPASPRLPLPGGCSSSPRRLPLSSPADAGGSAGRRAGGGGGMRRPEALEVLRALQQASRDDDDDEEAAAAAASAEGSTALPGSPCGWHVNPRGHHAVDTAASSTALGDAPSSCSGWRGGLRAEEHGVPAASAAAAAAAAVTEGPPASARAPPGSPRRIAASHAAPHTPGPSDAGTVRTKGDKSRQQQRTASRAGTPAVRRERVPAVLAATKGHLMQAVEALLQLEAAALPPASTAAAHVQPSLAPSLFPLDALSSAAAQLQQTATVTGRTFGVALDALACLGFVTRRGGHSGAQPVSAASSWPAASPLTAQAALLAALLQRIAAAEAGTAAPAAAVNTRNVRANAARNERVGAGGRVGRGGLQRGDTADDEGCVEVEGAPMEPTGRPSLGASHPSTPQRPGYFSFMPVVGSQQASLPPSQSSSLASSQLTASPAGAGGSTVQDTAAQQQQQQQMQRVAPSPRRARHKLRAVRFCTADFSTIDGAPAEVSPTMRSAPPALDEATNDSSSAPTAMMPETRCRLDADGTESGLLVTLLAPVLDASRAYAVAVRRGECGEAHLLQPLLHVLAALGACPSQALWRDALQAVLLAQPPHSGDSSSSSGFDVDSGGGAPAALSAAFSRACGGGRDECGTSASPSSVVSAPAHSSAQLCDWWDTCAAARSTTEQLSRLRHAGARPSLPALTNLPTPLVLPYADTLHNALSSAVRYQLRRAFNPHVYDSDAPPPPPPPPPPVVPGAPVGALPHASPPPRAGSSGASFASGGVGRGGGGIACGFIALAPALGCGTNGSLHYNSDDLASLVHRALVRLHRCRGAATRLIAPHSLAALVAEDAATALLPAGRGGGQAPAPLPRVVLSLQQLVDAAPIPALCDALEFTSAHRFLRYLLSHQPVLDALARGTGDAWMWLRIYARMSAQYDPHCGGDAAAAAAGDGGRGAGSGEPPGSEPAGCCDGGCSSGYAAPLASLQALAVRLDEEAAVADALKTGCEVTLDRHARVWEAEKARRAKAGLLAAGSAAATALHGRRSSVGSNGGAANGAVGAGLPSASAGGTKRPKKKQKQMSRLVAAAAPTDAAGDDPRGARTGGGATGGLDCSMEGGGAGGGMLVASAGASDAPARLIFRTLSPPRACGLLFGGAGDDAAGATLTPSASAASLLQATALDFASPPDAGPAAAAARSGDDAAAPASGGGVPSIDRVAASLSGRLSSASATGGGGSAGAAAAGSSRFEQLSEYEDLLVRGSVSSGGAGSGSAAPAPAARFVYPRLCVYSCSADARDVHYGSERPPPAPTSGAFGGGAGGGGGGVFEFTMAVAAAAAPAGAGGGGGTAGLVDLSHLGAGLGLLSSSSSSSSSGSGGGVGPSAAAAPRFPRPSHATPPPPAKGASVGMALDEDEEGSGGGSAGVGGAMRCSLGSSSVAAFASTSTAAWGARRPVAGVGSSLPAATAAPRVAPGSATAPGSGGVGPRRVPRVRASIGSVAELAPLPPTAAAATAHRSSFSPPLPSTAQPAGSSSGGGMVVDALSSAYGAAAQPPPQPLPVGAGWSPPPRAAVVSRPGSLSSGSGVRLGHALPPLAGGSRPLGGVTARVAAVGASATPPMGPSTAAARRRSTGGISSVGGRAASTLTPLPPPPTAGGGLLSSSLAAGLLPSLPGVPSFAAAAATALPAAARAPSAGAAPAPRPAAESAADCPECCEPLLAPPGGGAGLVVACRGCRARYHAACAGVAPEFWRPSDAYTCFGCSCQ